MQNMTNIRPAVHTDIRNNKKQSRIRMALVGSGVAGAMLISGLFGGMHTTHTTHATAHAQVHVVKTSAVASHTSAAKLTKTVHATAHTQTRAVKTGAVANHTSAATQIKAAPVSYNMANDYVGMAQQAANSAGISSAAFVRQIQQESGFNPNAGSPAGAEGIAQFMPGTAASMGVNPYDPSSALPGAARMMAGLASQYGGDYSKALAAYNAGGGAVDAAVAQGGGSWLSYMPAETQNYVSIIMG